MLPLKSLRKAALLLRLRTSLRRAKQYYYRRQANANQRQRRAS
jgi:hypothetical protein